MVSQKKAGALCPEGEQMRGRQKPHAPVLQRPGPTHANQQPPISHKSDTSGKNSIPPSSYLNRTLPVRPRSPGHSPPHSINSPPSCPFTPPSLQACIATILKKETKTSLLLRATALSSLLHSPEQLLQLTCFSPPASLLHHMSH